MAVNPASNFTANGLDFPVPTAGSDTFDDNMLIKGLKALDEHTHESTKGIQIPTGGIADSAVTAAKLASDAVTTAKITDANVTAAKLASDAVATAKILDANVTTAKIADSAVTTAKINDGAVTAAKISGAVQTLSRRQGGDATDWTTAGTNNYTPTSILEHCGCATATVADGNKSVLVTITYPTAFVSSGAIVFATVYSSEVSIADEAPTAAVIGLSSTECTILVTRQNPSSTSGEQSLKVYWRAIGPAA